MRCNKCNAFLSGDSMFCQRCGTKTEANDYDLAKAASVQQPTNALPEPSAQKPTVGERQRPINSASGFVPPLYDTEERDKTEKGDAGWKKNFCGLCGSAIDKQTRKCTGCGKQYFKGIKKWRTAIFAAIAVVVVIQLIALIHLQSTVNFYKDRVVVRASGSFTYHEYGCSHVAGEKNLTVYSLEEAKDKGFSPCPRCCD